MHINASSIIINIELYYALRLVYEFITSATHTKLYVYFKFLNDIQLMSGRQILRAGSDISI